MSLNGYSWVEGNTPNSTDPSGMCLDRTNVNNPLQPQQETPPIPPNQSNCPGRAPLTFADCRNASRDATITTCSSMWGLLHAATCSNLRRAAVQVLYFGGSQFGPDVDTNTIPYSNTEPNFARGQASLLYSAASYPIPYPGTPNSGPRGEVGKELQALQASNMLGPQSTAIALGYSAGADAALIFAYRYRHQFDMIGVGILGGSLDAGIQNTTDGLSKLDTEISSGVFQWQLMINDLLGAGIRIYILDDNVATPNFISFAQQHRNNRWFCYNSQPSLLHFLDVGQGTNATNRDPNVPLQALQFLRDGDRSMCSQV